MNNIKENKTTSDSLGALIYELIYQKYRIVRDEEKHLFSPIGLKEYITLYRLTADTDEESIYTERIYLNDISERTGLSIRQTSQFVRGMQDKGLVKWQHDGDGEEGTYITISRHGLRALKDTEKELEAIYGQVLEKFGEDQMLKLVHLMKELDQHLKEVLQTMEEAKED